MFDFNATDPDGDNLTYSILHGEDAQYLELIPSTGLLSFVSLPDFENPDDKFRQPVRGDGPGKCGNASAILNVVVEVTDEVETVPNAAPQFQSDGNYSVPENQAFVFDFNATDPDGDNLTYSILHGEDAQYFEINVITGTLSFVSLPDFENPDDNNSDNRYEATVQVMAMPVPY